MTDTTQTLSDDDLRFEQTVESFTRQIAHLIAHIDGGDYHVVTDECNITEIEHGYSITDWFNHLSDDAKTALRKAHSCQTDKELLDELTENIDLDDSDEELADNDYMRLLTEMFEVVVHDNRLVRCDCELVATGDLDTASERLLERCYGTKTYVAIGYDGEYDHRDTHVELTFAGGGPAMVVRRDFDGDTMVVSDWFKHRVVDVDDLDVLIDFYCPDGY